MVEARSRSRAAAVSTADGGPLNLRDEGRVRVLRALQERGHSSRPELIRHTGLSRATVAALITDLIACGVVDETSPRDDRSGRAGRPAQSLSITASAAYAGAIDIGHDHLRVVVCDARGSPIWEESTTLDVDHAPVQTIDLAAGLIQKAVRSRPILRDRLLGVAVGIACPVDKTRNTLRAQGIMADWLDVNPAHELARRTGLSTELINDANAGALGEWLYGAARGYEDVIYIRLSAGIGAGVIADGRLLRGANGLAGEMGHLQVDASGRICRCGNRGCLETVASPTAIADLLSTSWNRPVTTDELFRLTGREDPGALRAIEDAGYAIGKCIATMVTLFDPNLIVIGGELSAVGEPLFESVRRSIHRHVMPVFQHDLHLVSGELGDEAPVRGAAGIVLARAPDMLALVSIA